MKFLISFLAKSWESVVFCFLPPVEEKFLFVLDFCQKKKGVEEEVHKT